MTSQTETWIKEAARMRSFLDDAEHSCPHEYAVPNDEAACFGWCPDCNRDDIPNYWAGHYPCTHPVPIGARA